MKVSPSGTNSGGKVKTAAFLFSVKTAADLRFVVTVVCPTCWILDYGDVGAFGDISGPLDGHTVCNDARSNALHKFQLWNVPIVNDIFFSAATPRLDNGLLVNVEPAQGSLNSGACIFINSLRLCEVVKIHERTNGDKKTLRDCPSDEWDHVALHISMITPSHLL